MCKKESCSTWPCTFWPHPLFLSRLLVIRREIETILQVRIGKLGWLCLSRSFFMQQLVDGKMKTNFALSTYPSSCAYFPAVSVVFCGHLRFCFYVLLLSFCWLILATKATAAAAAYWLTVCMKLLAIFIAFTVKSVTLGHIPASTGLETITIMNFNRAISTGYWRLSL